SRYCIVVITYNRVESLSRLLSSLLRARYDAQVDLIISIDGGNASEPTYRRVVDFVWPFGAITVRRFEENLGLRRHVISCGKAAEEYDAMIMLEDDIVVGQNYFLFAR